MLILGIETSCDETSAAVVDEHRVLSNIVATQMIHQLYGGVVPEFASRAHLQRLPTVVRTALQQAGIEAAAVDGIAVTCGPGLAGSLLVGVCFAKGLAMRLGRPLIGVNHIEGHIAAAAADDSPLPFPYIALVVSGGHSLLVLAEAPFAYRIIGSTLDDAAGEAFDKAAKILGLGYPGGPAVERAAKDGDPAAVPLPRPLLDREDFNFSFSGLKTALLYTVHDLKRQNRTLPVADLAASFEQAVVDVLVEKTVRATRAFSCRRLVLAGGVMRNSRLRAAFEEACRKHKLEARVPAPLLCTDNAGMIARAGYLRLAAGQRSDWSLDVKPNLQLGETC